MAHDVPDWWAVDRNLRKTQAIQADRRLAAGRMDGQEMEDSTVDVLAGILRAAERMYEVAGTSHQWAQQWSLSDRNLASLRGLRATASRNRNHDLALRASLEIVRRATGEARSDQGVKAFERGHYRRRVARVHRAGKGRGRAQG
jgi:hypothetical protein